MPSFSKEKPLNEHGSTAHFAVPNDQRSNREGNSMKRVKILPRPPQRQRQLGRLFKLLMDSEAKTQKIRDRINRFILADRIITSTDD
jgi:hypothetical protein